MMAWERDRRLKDKLNYLQVYISTFLATTLQLRLLVWITTLLNDLVKFITQDRMLRNTYLYENRMLTNIVNAASFGGGKGKLE